MQGEFWGNTTSHSDSPHSAFGPGLVNVPAQAEIPDAGNPDDSEATSYKYFQSVLAVGRASD